MAEVKLVNLYKKYGEVEAVKNINIDCKDKEFLCLLGPSGCGKTSTLRMVAGLETITSGDIYIDNKLVNFLLPKDRDIAMVFETYALYPNKTVYENLAFPLRIRRVSKDQVNKKVKEVAEILDIVPQLNRKPAQLSGGQKQRVSIGRAIVRSPKVFLMDEPISHLDAKLREHMRGELKRMQKELDATTIYVTHDQVEALSMADRIAVMNFGVLQQLGTPNEIYNKPSNVFVANFVGSPSMNLIDCDLTIENNDLVVIIEGNKFKFKSVLEKIKKIQLPSDRKVILGIRPENIKIYKDKSLDSQLIQGNIYITEPLGDIVIVDIKVGKNIIRVKSDALINYEINEKVFLELNPEAIHIFDKKTTNAIY